MTTPSQENNYEYPTKKRSRFKKFFSFFFIVILVLLLLGGYGYWKYTKQLEPVSTESDEIIEVQIPAGSTTADIGNILEENNLIQDSLIFTIYSRVNNEGGYQAGYYSFSPSQDVPEVVETFNEGGADISQSELDRITLPEGSDILEVIAIMAGTVEESEDEILELLEDNAFHEELLADFPRLLTSAMEAKDDTLYTLEGYLYPATYDYHKNLTTKDLIYQMVKTTDDLMRQYYDEIESRDLTVHQVLTLSSLVEEEANNDEDRRLIAGVFLNRLDIDMMLQTDVSVSYANGEHLERVSLEDADVDSPYNLYRHTGLGPGPVNNGSVNSVDAVLNPEETDYLFFLADIDTEKTYFSETFEEHLEKQAIHVNKTEPSDTSDENSEVSENDQDDSSNN